MSDDSPKSILKGFAQKLKDRALEAISGATWLLLAGLLAKYGDSVSDSVHHALGSKWMLIAMMSMLCSTIYFLILASQRPKPLVWDRHLYWRPGDLVPFCKNCFDLNCKEIHLSWSPYREKEK